MTARTQLNEKLSSAAREARIDQLAWIYLLWLYAGWLLCVVTLWFWLESGTSLGVWLALTGGGLAVAIALAWWLAERNVKRGERKHRGT